MAQPSAMQKFKRATVRLDALGREMQEWLTDHPYDLLHEASADHRCHAWTMVFDEEPPHSEWALTMGEVIHNLRGALDHAIYHYAQLDGGSDPPDWWRSLQFPICDSEKLFDEQVKRRRLYGLDPIRIERIRLVQPYMDLEGDNGTGLETNRHLLAVLRDINDSDKHRLPETILCHSRSQVVRYRDHRGEVLDDHLRIGPVTGDEPFIQVTFSEPSPDVEIEAHADLLLILRDYPIGIEDDWSFVSLIAKVGATVGRVIGFVNQPL